MKNRLNKRKNRIQLFLADTVFFRFSLAKLLNLNKDLRIGACFCVEMACFFLQIIKVIKTKLYLYS